MKNIMKKVNWKMIVTIIAILAMTSYGVYCMEENWIESVSGVIWIVGEVLIVETILCEKIMKDFYKWIKDDMDF